MQSEKACEKCGSPAFDEKIAGVYGVYVCDLCIKAHPQLYSLITKTAAMKEFLLTAEELDDRDRLPHMERPNPHKSSWHNMQLFLRKQVTHFAVEKHGSLEQLELNREEWVKSKVKRKEKRYAAKLVELRKKTRADSWKPAGSSPTARHVHVFEESEHGRECTDCGFKIKYET